MSPLWKYRTKLKLYFYRTLYSWNAYSTGVRYLNRKSHVNIISYLFYTYYKTLHNTTTCKYKFWKNGLSSVTQVYSNNINKCSLTTLLIVFKNIFLYSPQTFDVYIFIFSITPVPERIVRERFKLQLGKLNLLLYVGIDRHTSVMFTGSGFSLIVFKSSLIACCCHVH